MGGRRIEALAPGSSQNSVGELRFQKQRNSNFSFNALFSSKKPSSRLSSWRESFLWLLAISIVLSSLVLVGKCSAHTRPVSAGLPGIGAMQERDQPETEG